MKKKKLKSDIAIMAAENERTVTGMAEYIEREALLCMVQPDDPSDEMAAITIATAKKLIRNIVSRTQAADVAPIRHGRWINAHPDIEPNPMFMYGICSECGFEQGISKYLNYCPNCGCRMDGERT